MYAFLREQEKRLGDLEDELRDQQEATEALASDAAHDAKCLRATVASKQRQLDETKDDVKTLQDLIDRNAHDFAQRTFERNQRIAQLQEEAEMLRAQAADVQLHEKIHKLQEQLSSEAAAAVESATKAQRYFFLPSFYHA